MNVFGALGGAVTLILFVFLVVLAILWIILPFAVLGTNKRLDKIMGHMDTMNKNIIEVLNAVKQVNEVAQGTEQKVD